MLSIIITAYKEKKTVGRAVESFVNPERNSYQSVEILIVCPDEETWKKAEEVAKSNSFKKFRWIKDPGKGKPVALNLAFEKATGDIFFLTDGDVYVSDHAIENMTSYFDDPDIGAVTGRPVSVDSKDTMMGYYGHLLADAAHHKRSVTMIAGSHGRAKQIAGTNPGFFVISGYVCMIRKIDLTIPIKTLSDDAYISYTIHNAGLKIAYEPSALAFIKYPSTIKDWYKQKLRSLGGYVQLWQLGVITPSTKTRSFIAELRYFWFPLLYAVKDGSIFQKIVRLLWSIWLYPLRLFLWIGIYWERRVMRKSFEKTWVRVESTK